MMDLLKNKGGNMNNERFENTYSSLMQGIYVAIVSFLYCGVYH